MGEEKSFPLGHCLLLLAPGENATYLRKGAVIMKPISVRYWFPFFLKQET